MTSNDEWLTSILLNKFKTNNIKLVKVKNSVSKFFKFLILLNIIDIFKIFYHMKKKKIFDVIIIEEKAVNRFIRRRKNNKIFLCNYEKKITYNFKNVYNCHPSLLPNYKGLLPIPRYLYDRWVNNISNNLGVSIHKINQKFDCGKIMWNKRIYIKKNLSIKELYEQVYSNFYYGILDILKKKD